MEVPGLPESRARYHGSQNYEEAAAGESGTQRSQVGPVYEAQLQRILEKYDSYTDCREYDLKFFTSENMW